MGTVFYPSALDKSGLIAAGLVADHCDRAAAVGNRFFTRNG